MSIKTVVSVDLEAKIRGLDEQIERDKKKALASLAYAVTNYSEPFVDTGAFVTSFSFTVGRGRPRGKSSHGLPRRQNKSAKAREGYKLLLSDLDKVDLKGSTSTIVLRNNSPHAEYVDARHGVRAYLGGSSSVKRR